MKIVNVYGIIHFAIGALWGACSNHIWSKYGVGVAVPLILAGLILALIPMTRVSKK